MNFIEMAVKQLVDKIPEMVGNLPPDVKATIDKILQITAGYDDKLDRILRQQEIILKHLGVTQDDGPAETPRRLLGNSGEIGGAG